jgi:hypothetical protein
MPAPLNLPEILRIHGLEPTGHLFQRLTTLGANSPYRDPKGLRDPIATTPARRGSTPSKGRPSRPQSLETRDLAKLDMFPLSFDQCSALLSRKPLSAPSLSR